MKQLDKKLLELCSCVASGESPFDKLCQTIGPIGGDNALERVFIANPLHVFHRRHEIGVHFRDASVRLLPWLEEVLFSTARTPSWLNDSASSSSTTLSVKCRSAQ